MSQGSTTETQPVLLAVRSQAAALSFDVVVVPRASRSRIVGVHAGSLKVTLAAPPVDGAANQALCDLISKALQLPKRAVQITRGEHSKHKTLTVTGATVAQVQRLCPLTDD